MTAHRPATDPAVACLERELKASLDRMAESLGRLEEQAHLLPITFRADARLEQRIARFMARKGRHNQSAAIRHLVEAGLNQEDSTP